MERKGRQEIKRKQIEHFEGLHRERKACSCGWEEPFPRFERVALRHEVWSSKKKKNKKRKCFSISFLLSSFLSLLRLVFSQFVRNQGWERKWYPKYKATEMSRTMMASWDTERLRFEEDSVVDFLGADFVVWLEESSLPLVWSLGFGGSCDWREGFGGFEGVIEAFVIGLWSLELVKFFGTSEITFPDFISSQSSGNISNYHCWKHHPKNFRGEWMHL